MDLSIGLRYYFDKNNEDLKVYKQSLSFTLIFFIELVIGFIDLLIDFIDLFIELRFYFNTNNRV